ncbi:VTC domain-containing protein [Lishizhenia tianjinensis]|uniref:VTC domain-containing protein n=1 Tax=Lishizhenia tianjinensis TaxID=477690 RepID=A0A1I6ZP39_9FLAO|nr:polyphosphate polymerase domain-containing protein [Lishizhenia tianjinensis]SFT64473.1 VTC domain-containing protein [Lishizhenia tianjinensis]
MKEVEELVQNFRPISLAEMDTVKLMNRVDTKFAFTREELNALLPKLQEHYQILEVDGIRIPTYKSLYFDDDNFSFYKDHHNGKNSRYKVRFRKYVESDLMFLEVKHKFKGRVKKKRIKVDDFEAQLSKQSLNFVHKHVEDLGAVEAKMWNVYRRITLVNLELEERLTLDINLQFNWKEEVKKFDDLVIAEIKQEKVNRNSPFFSVMKNMGIRPYRLSKYCIGTIELYSQKKIKYNRFKEKLLKLKKINNNVA